MNRLTFLSAVSNSAVASGRSLSAFIVAVVLGLAFAGAALAQTTSKVDVRNFEVISVDGNKLVVRDERGTNELHGAARLPLYGRRQEDVRVGAEAGDEGHRDGDDQDHDHAGLRHPSQGRRRVEGGAQHSGNSGRPEACASALRRTSWTSGVSRSSRTAR